MTTPELLEAAKLVLVPAAPIKPKRRIVATAIEAVPLEEYPITFI